jgi:hypothetical protein
MPYTNPEKQKEAMREIMRKRRAEERDRKLSERWTQLHPEVTKE